MSDSLEGAEVMVTGGCGFIGSHLAHALAAHGAKRIVVVDSLRYGKPENLGALADQVEMVKHTFGESPRDLLKPALEGVTHLFHLAAEKHNQSKDSPARVYQSNIVGTHTLFEDAVEAGVKKIVFTSSLYAYGRMTGAPFVESEVPQPRTVYGISKLAGEHILAHFGQTRDVAWNVLRYLFVYGPKQLAGQGYKSVIMKNFERILRGEPPVILGDGKQELDYVFVDDVVEATLSAMDSPVTNEVVNIASGHGTRIDELTEAMLRVSGSALRPTHGPSDWTQGSCRVGSADRAAEVLGWRATTPLDVGLRRTFDWIRQNPEPSL
jgi:UDP-glucose 4-epimerase